MTMLSQNSSKAVRIVASKATQKIATENDPRWRLVQKRDLAADGKFYYSVSTTGIYCKPSCAARAARPEHVQFHQTCADAEHAGFRACKLVNLTSQIYPKRTLRLLPIAAVR